MGKYADSTRRTEALSGTDQETGVAAGVRDASQNCNQIVTIAQSDVSSNTFAGGDFKARR
jgi:hypothetical protein